MWQISLSEIKNARCIEWVQFPKTKNQYTKQSFHAVKTFQGIRLYRRSISTNVSIALGFPESVSNEV